MEIKITSTGTLQISVSEHDENTKNAETLFIEQILGLRHDGDSIKLIRKNAYNLSRLAYLETQK